MKKEKKKKLNLNKNMCANTLDSGHIGRAFMWERPKAFASLRDGQKKNKFNVPAPPLERKNPIEESI